MDGDAHGRVWMARLCVVFEADVQVLVGWLVQAMGQLFRGR